MSESMLEYVYIYNVSGCGSHEIVFFLVILNDCFGNMCILYPGNTAILYPNPKSYSDGWALVVSCQFFTHQWWNPKKSRKKHGSWASSRFQYHILHCLKWTPNSVIQWLSPTSFFQRMWAKFSSYKWFTSHVGQVGFHKMIRPTKKVSYKMAGFTGHKSLQHGSFLYKDGTGNRTGVPPFHSGHVHRDKMY